MTTQTAFVGLGSNIENPAHQIKAALLKLRDKLPETTLVSHSSLYTSHAQDLTNQPDFINAVAKLNTTLPPLTLLSHLQQIELEQGRMRNIRYGPRTLDLDLLLYGETHYESDTLTLPHPRMYTRHFVLLPLMELTGDLLLPNGNNISHHLNQCDTNDIRRLTEQALSPMIE